MRATSLRPAHVLCPQRVLARNPFLSATCFVFATRLLCAKHFTCATPFCAERVLRPARFVCATRFTCQVKSGQVSTGFFVVGIELYQKDRVSGSECHLVQIDPMGRGASRFGSNVKGTSNVVPFLSLHNFLYLR